LCPRLLWEEIANARTQIFNSSLATGKVPDDWRTANMALPYKEGCRDKPGNYRPVSFTSVVGKLLEKLLKENIYFHLEAKLDQ